ncbi:hypothetical protein N7456_010928 [Penicillium angulare]|uniref:Uncharacterized protein n=1 Tax=Penicillium angulare TaxID=116970 RepID=A0A9W9ESP6_9EURO|nr:hypothetical protein N7456_010928 [Penicillium angulare]
MPSLKNLLPVAVALSLTTATAATTTTCPTNWLSDTFNITRCCYGNMLLEDTTPYCCVYDTNPEVTEANAVTTTATDDGCFTKIPFTATDYSDLVSSASSKLLAETTAASNEATATSSSSSTASASGSSGSGSGSGSASVSGATSTSSGGAAPIATACEVIIGGAAVVAGLFVL